MMRAVVLTKTCRAEDLQISEVPIPEVKPSWVLIKVRTFGLNRSELYLRSYEADEPYIKLPRIPGIECVGEIIDPSDSNLKPGQAVIALMGGMGRSFDGSYAEFALLPVSHVFTVERDLSWTELAAIPETYFTAYGSLFESLQLVPTDTIFIRGATSALGLASLQLAKSIGCIVAVSTRTAENIVLLKRYGADVVLLDDGTISRQFYDIFPKGINKILELVGPATLEESITFLAHKGTLCVTGMLGNKGVIENFDPIKYIPNGVYMTSFFSNYPKQEIIDTIFSHIRNHALKPIIGKVFPFENIAGAHQLMERNEAHGKVVIVIDK
ncbi:zinc-binding dehydrogenase [Methanospirillum sp.]|uniref:zinc-binding dehydrogenase n=1 Tax=Methanospirillum sp. TaxID=45200 RepID=UPI00359FA813